MRVLKTNRDEFFSTRSTIQMDSGRCYLVSTVDDETLVFNCHLSGEVLDYREVFGVKVNDHHLILSLIDNGSIPLQ